MNAKNIFVKFFLLFILNIFIFSSSVVFADDMNDDEDVLDVLSQIEDEVSVETSSNTNPNNLNLNSRSCVVIDRLSKSVLFGKNEKNKVKMASTTKIMTAIVIIENYDLSQTVEVSKKAANTGGSRLGLKTGDKITIQDLLYGLLLRSGNDAAVCLAESIAGSISEFSNLMNSKAKELNLLNTHFESPHGLDSDEHYTTAYELAILADYSLKNSTFSKIVGTKNYTITINGYPKNLSNTNELLGNLDGVYGVKTGFTNGANRCLISSCKRGNMDIICVVLGADTKKFRTQDSIKLIEYTFKNFEYINIEEKINTEFKRWKDENINSFNIYKGKSNDIELHLSKIENSIIPVKKDLIDKIKVEISCNKNIYPIINKDEKIGNIIVNIEDSNILNCNILTSNKIDKKNFIDYFFNFIIDFKEIISDNLNSIKC